ncbi:hypothetical protein FJY93_01890 [Candidatus Kaiserbacteria bacterium]|nr:hypothetical protein [Candidatus Kaiserbacteria bacterium]
MITHANPVVHPRMPGVTVFPMSGQARRGEHQQVLVCVEPHGVIPPHTHDVDATMRIAAGSGRVLCEGSEHGTEVGPGSCVFFAALGLHGFEAGPEGLIFLSENGGIVGEDGTWDIQFPN